MKISLYFFILVLVTLCSFGLCSDVAFAAPKTCLEGGSHTLVFLEDGTLWAWGNNGYGKLDYNYIMLLQLLPNQLTTVRIANSNRSASFSLKLELE